MLLGTHFLFMSLHYGTTDDIFIADHVYNCMWRVVKNSSAPLSYGPSFTQSFHCKTILSDSRFPLQLFPLKLTRSLIKLSYSHVRASTMVLEQKVYIMQLRGPQENFLNSSAQAKLTPKSKHVGPLCMPTMRQAFLRHIRWGRAGWLKIDWLGSAIQNTRTMNHTLWYIQGLSKVPFTCVMQYQKYPRKMWRFLQERNCATTTFSKANGHSTLMQLKYTGQLMHEYATK